MREEGYITDEQEAAANLEPVNSIKPSDDLRPANAWVEEVQARLFTDPRYAVLGADRAAREERRAPRRPEDLHDARPSRPGERAGSRGQRPSLRSRLLGFGRGDRPDDRRGASAMVGGKSFETSQFNIATDGIGRQPGSTWKVITLADRDAEPLLVQRSGQRLVAVRLRPGARGRHRTPRAARASCPSARRRTAR